MDPLMSLCLETGLDPKSPFMTGLCQYVRAVEEVHLVQARWDRQLERLLQAGPPSPANGRQGHQWTPEEDRILIQLKVHEGQNSNEQIAYILGRHETEVLIRWGSAPELGARRAEYVGSWVRMREAVEEAVRIMSADAKMRAEAKVLAEESDEYFQKDGFKSEEKD